MLFSAGNFNSEIIVQTRNLEDPAHTDPMEPPNIWTDIARLYCCVRMKKNPKLEKYDQDFFIGSTVLIFIVRGIHSFPSGSTRIIFNGKYYEPVGITHLAGVYRGEYLTYIESRLMDDGVATQF
jgi:hypothetical protein